MITTWEGTKILISMKQKANILSLITKDEKYINNPVSITNTSNDFFTSIAEIFH